MICAASLELVDVGGAQGAAGDERVVATPPVAIPACANSGTEPLTRAEQLRHQRKRRQSNPTAEASPTTDRHFTGAATQRFNQDGPPLPGDRSAPLPDSSPQIALCRSNDLG
ncbi:hypothetical protein FRAHR75_980010 [Frankia sp. Hr75.2]|nr:hypothetical protein FRAHR75_980010 [Frankia sp. Hr75.2]